MSLFLISITIYIMGGFLYWLYNSIYTFNLDVSGSDGDSTVLNVFWIITLIYLAIRNSYRVLRHHCLFYKNFIGKFKFFEKIRSLRLQRDRRYNGKRYFEDRAIWFKNGKQHRTNGPAVVYVDGFYAGQKEWWINGNKIECSSQKEFKKLMKLKAFM